MPTVYDSNGKSYDVESVDAREYVASGNYFHQNPLDGKHVEENAVVVSTDSVDIDHKKKSKK